MDLFNQLEDQPINLLPNDAAANDYLLNLLESIEWRNDEAIILGKLTIPSAKSLGMVSNLLNILIPRQQKQHCLGLTTLLC